MFQKIYDKIPEGKKVFVIGVDNDNIKETYSCERDKAMKVNIINAFKIPGVKDVVYSVGSAHIFEQDDEVKGSRLGSLLHISKEIETLTVKNFYSTESEAYKIVQTDIDALEKHHKGKEEGIDEKKIQLKQEAEQKTKSKKRDFTETGVGDPINEELKTEIIIEEKKIKLNLIDKDVSKKIITQEKKHDEIEKTINEEIKIQAKKIGKNIKEKVIISNINVSNSGSSITPVNKDKDKHSVNNITDL